MIAGDTVNGVIATYASSLSNESQNDITKTPKERRRDDEFLSSSQLNRKCSSRGIAFHIGTSVSDNSDNGGSHDSNFVRPFTEYSVRMDFFLPLLLPYGTGTRA